MSNLNLTFGTDPEVAFVQGYPASVLPAGVVYKNVGVTDPITLMDGTIIADGAAMEFQPQAAMDIQELVDNLRSLIKYGDDMLNTYLQRNGRPGRESPDIVFMPEVPIDLSWCDEDPDLAVFGCSPDQSAYGEECRPGTIDASKHPWRYFGCHIHIGVLVTPGISRTRPSCTTTSRPWTEPWDSPQPSSQTTKTHADVLSMVGPASTDINPTVSNTVPHPT